MSEQENAPQIPGDRKAILEKAIRIGEYALVKMQKDALEKNEPNDEQPLTSQELAAKVIGENFTIYLDDEDRPTVRIMDDPTDRDYLLTHRRVKAFLRFWYLRVVGKELEKKLMNWLSSDDYLSPSATIRIPSPLRR